MLKRKPAKSLLIRFFICFFLLSVFLAGSWSGIEIHDLATEKGCFQFPENVVPISLPENMNRIHFIALGDVGTYDENQKRVARAMAKVCKKQQCDFIVFLGDNFYKHGVASLADINFKKQFEDIYYDFGIPLFAILGNHDAQGNMLSQIIYSLKNPTWKMPNFNYDFKAGPAAFFATNTNCMLFSAKKLYQRVKSDDSDWKFVFGHHTLYSNGTNGDANFILKKLWHSFFQNSVDFYLCGHDHELEHLHIKNQDTDYIVSGAGGNHYRNLAPDKITGKSNADSRFLYKDNGFVWFEVRKSQVKVIFYNANGESIYSFTRYKQG